MDLTCAFATSCWPRPWPDGCSSCCWRSARSRASAARTGSCRKSAARPSSRAPEQVKGFALVRAYPDQGTRFAGDRAGILAPAGRHPGLRQAADVRRAGRRQEQLVAGQGRQDPALPVRRGQQGLHAADFRRADRRRRQQAGQGRRTEGVHRRTRSRGRLRLAGQRAAGEGIARPAGGVGQRRRGRRRVPARRGEIPAAVLRRIPARRPPAAAGSSDSDYDDKRAAVEAGQAGLRQPLRARRQAQRARADLPAAAGHRRAAGAGPVFRGDEEVRRSSRTSSRPRSSPSATSACMRARTRTSCTCIRRRCRAARRWAASSCGCSTRRARPSSRARPTATATRCWTTRCDAATCWSRSAAATCRCCRSTSRRWTCPNSRSPAANQAWFDVFAWSGRDLYRPGETVRVSALFRDNDGKPVAAKGKGAQPLFVRLKQPDGKTFLDSRDRTRRRSATSSSRRRFPSMRRPGAGRSSSAPIRRARKRSRA